MKEILTDDVLFNKYVHDLLEAIKNNFERKRDAKSSNNRTRKDSVKAIEDINFLDMELYKEPSRLLKDLEPELEDASKYLSKADIDTIKGAFRFFYEHYDKENKKRIDQANVELYNILIKFNMSTIILRYGPGKKNSESLVLNKNRCERIGKEAKKRSDIMHIDTSIYYGEKAVPNLSWEEKKIVEKSKVVCLSSDIEKRNGFRNIRSIGYNKIQEIYETININNNAIIHMEHVKFALIDKLKTIVNEKNKERLKKLIESINGVIRRKKEQNAQLKNSLSKLEIDKLDTMLPEEKQVSKEEKEAEQKVYDTLNKFKNSKGEKMDKFKAIDTNEEIKNNKENIQSTIEELRIRAYELLYDTAENEINAEFANTELDSTDRQNKIHEKMMENLRMINNTPEERAKMYLNANNIPETPQAINDLLPTFMDYNIGVKNYKDLMYYVQNNVENKEEATKIIEDAMGIVFNYEQVEVKTK